MTSLFERLGGETAVDAAVDKPLALSRLMPDPF
jgi:hypothetical protein